MKRLLFSLLTVSVFMSCHSQSAKQTAVAEKKAIEAARPGTIATKAGSWTMTATIDGKPWAASSMMPPEASGRIIGYYKDGYIGLPYWNSAMEEGHTITFAQGNAVDLWVTGGHDFWGGREGEMVITKVANNWAEGKFHFIAAHQGSQQKVIVTDGFFRIPLSSR